MIKEFLNHGVIEFMSALARNVIYSALLFLTLSLFNLACSSDSKTNINKVIKNNSKSELELNREGWLNRNVYQVIESVPLQGQTFRPEKDEIPLELKKKVFYRCAQLIALSRYNLYKDDFPMIKKLYQYRPFRKVMKGEYVHFQQEGNTLRTVYRVESNELIRSVKNVLNNFEELNPSLRKKIKESDLSF